MRKKRINTTIQRAERVDVTSCDHLVFSYSPILAPMTNALYRLVLAKILHERGTLKLLHLMLF